MMLRKKTKQNPVLGCFITLLTIVGLLLVCFLFCTVVFQLNQAGTASTSGSLFAFLFG